MYESPGKTRGGVETVPRVPRTRLRVQLVLEMGTSEGEFSFTNTAAQFDADYGRSRTVRILEAERQASSGFDPLGDPFPSDC